MRLWLEKDLPAGQLVVVQGIAVRGQGIVDLRIGKMLRQQLRDPLAIVLVVHLVHGMRTLHDAGDKETHGKQLRGPL